MPWQKKAGSLYCESCAAKANNGGLDRRGGSYVFNRQDRFLNPNNLRAIWI